LYSFRPPGSHRDYFIPALGAGNPDEHAEPPTTGVAWISFAVLVLALVTSLGDHKPPKPAESERAMEFPRPPISYRRVPDERMGVEVFYSLLTAVEPSIEWSAYSMV
jgi:hypothetical protein